MRVRSGPRRKVAFPNTTQVSGGPVTVGKAWVQEIRLPSTSYRSAAGHFPLAAVRGEVGHRNEANHLSFPESESAVPPFTIKSSSTRLSNRKSRPTRNPLNLPFFTSR